MDYLAMFLHGLLGLFTQRMAVRQTIPVRRNDRRAIPEAGEGGPVAPLSREAGFGWMNVASVYESGREPPRWGDLPAVLDNIPKRRGG